MAEEKVHSDWRKIYVEGLREDVMTEEGKKRLENYFRNGGWGGVEEDSTRVLKKEGPMGAKFFAFITFDELDGPDRCFKERPLMYPRSGKGGDLKEGEEQVELTVKRAVPKGPQNLCHCPKTKKLFIANVPTKTGLSIEHLAADLQIELEKGLNPLFGGIETPVLIKKPKKEDGTEELDEHGHPALRGIGFVMCSSEDVADRIALTKKTLEFRGRTIEIKKSEDRKKMGMPFGMGRGGKGMQQWGGYGGGYGYGYFPPYGGGYGGYGGYGQWDGQQSGRGGKNGAKGGAKQQNYQPY